MSAAEATVTELSLTAAGSMLCGTVVAGWLLAARSWRGRGRHSRSARFAGGIRVRMAAAGAPPADV